MDYLPKAPKVKPTELCNLYGNGAWCHQPTGSDLTVHGVDVDLCPTHRDEMHEQRKVNWLEYTGKEIPEDYYDD